LLDYPVQRQKEPVHQTNSANERCIQGCKNEVSVLQEVCYLLLIAIEEKSAHRKEDNSQCGPCQASLFLDRFFVFHRDLFSFFRIVVKLPKLVSARFIAGAMD
jgi:hypothetical protein